ncbi:MAG: TonB-dependent receptor [Sphingomonadaceae bacterium]
MSAKLTAFRLLMATSILMTGWSAASAQVAADPVVKPGPDTGRVGEIVVTAQKRQESVQDVPISITALSGSDLAKRQIRAAEDLVTTVSNLQVNSPLGDGIPVFSLRGITMSDIGLAQNGPVAVYYDEVYKGNFAIMGLGMFDLERVEVLKGPQGTLYGKNTTGGAVNLITRKPGFNTEGYFSVGYGNYDRIMSDGAVELGIAPSLGLRVAYTFERADGTAKNVYADAPDPESTRQYGVRASLRYQPNDAVDITIRAATTLQNPRSYAVYPIEGPDGIGYPIYSSFGMPAATRAGLDRREVRIPYVPRRHFRTWAVAANADFQLSDTLMLTSITSWDRGKIRFTEDGDGSEANDSLVSYGGRTRQVTQDLRLTSDFDGPFNFILGAYYSVEKLKNDTTLRFYHDVDVNSDGSIDGQDCIDGGGFVACTIFNQFNQKKTSYALYSDASYDITDQITVRGGLRYTHDKADLTGFRAQLFAVDGTPLLNLIPGSVTDFSATTSRRARTDNVSGKIGLDYKPADNVLLYASYSVGYRGASFNSQAFFAPDELTTVKPEKLRATEVGFKTDWFDRKVTLNGAAFWYSYLNQQTLNVDPDTALQLLISLPRARILGAELDLQVRPTSRLTLSAGAGLLDTRVQKGIGPENEFRGNRLISAPKLTLTASVDWVVPVGTWGAADLRVDLSHSSGQYYDLANSAAAFEDQFTVMNARMRLHPESDRFGVALWVKNLTNTCYRTNRIDVLEGFGYVYTHVNDPPTYGVTVDIKF